MRRALRASQEKIAKATYAPPIARRVWDEAMRLTAEAERIRREHRENRTGADVYFREVCAR